MPVAEIEWSAETLTFYCFGTVPHVKVFGPAHSQDLVKALSSVEVTWVGQGGTMRHQFANFHWDASQRSYVWKVAKVDQNLMRRMVFYSSFSGGSLLN